MRGLVVLGLSIVLVLIVRMFAADTLGDALNWFGATLVVLAGVVLVWRNWRGGQYRIR